MEMLFLPVIAVGWALTALMIAAVRSDLSKPGTRRRGRFVLIGSLLLVLGPLIVEAVIKSINAPAEALLLLSVTFGVAAMLLYAAALIGAFAWRFVSSLDRGR